MAKLNSTPRTRLDDRLAAAKPIERLQPPPKGWIRALRDGLGMSGSQLGERIGVTPQNIENLEKSEAAGTIQLQTLRKVAEAMDATLVYALVPNTSLEETVARRAHEIAQRALNRVSHTMTLEAQGTGEGDLQSRIDEYILNELNDRDLWRDA